MSMPSFLDLNGYGHLLVEGAMMTIVVALIAMFIALCLGMAAALAKLSSRIWLRRLGGSYTVIIRGIPELVLMMVVYYGGTVLLQDLLAWAGDDSRVDINAFFAGSLVVGFVYGAYATEIFRTAFLAVPQGQIEAARGCGMVPQQIFFRIRLPQAWRFALPGLGNLWLTLLKATSITSIIGLTELARQADLVKSATQRPFITFLIACLLYLAMTAVSDLALRRFAAKAAAGFQRQDG